MDLPIVVSAVAIAANVVVSVFSVRSSQKSSARALDHALTLDARRARREAAERRFQRALGYLERARRLLRKAGNTDATTGKPEKDELTESAYELWTGLRLSFGEQAAQDVVLGVVDLVQSKGEGEKLDYRVVPAATGALERMQSVLQKMQEELERLD